jgi:hypothetical protein
MAMADVLSPQDTQKLADRAALATPIAAAKDVTTLPWRAIFGAANSAIRGVNTVLPVGTNIPYIPKQAFGPTGDSTSMTPFSDVLAKNTGSVGGNWGDAATAAMPKTAPPPVVPAPAPALSATPSTNVASPAAAAAPAPLTGGAVSPVGSITKTTLNADGTAGKTLTMQAPAPAPASPPTPAQAAGATGGGIIDPTLATQAGIDQHVAYVQRILPILMQAASSYGDPRNAGGHLQSLMHAFGNMDPARENVSGANAINTGTFGTRQTALNAATQMSLRSAELGEKQHEFDNTAQPIGTETTYGPGGMPMGTTTTYGARVGASPITPISASKPKTYVKDMIYQSGGEQRKYGGKDAAGNDIWLPVK